MRPTRRTSLAFVPLLVLLAAPATLRAQDDRIDPRAQEAVKRMATFLAGAKAFTVEAEESFDAEFARSYRVQLTNVRTVTVERPSRFVADATGDTVNRSSWYDGRSLTVLNRKANAYSTLEMPGTIDGVLDTLAADYEVFLPLSDFVYADPYKALMEGVLYGKYLGLHQAAGVPCHHLSFGQEGLEWQIWIDAGAQPWPRKFTIAYWEQSGVPQYEATFRRWTLDPKVAADAFRFVPPAGSKKVEVGELAR